MCLTNYGRRLCHVDELVESAWVSVGGLTIAEATALEALGQRLAVGGSSDIGRATSLIQCRRTLRARWQIRVNECVGVVGVSGRTWVVRPKIPLSHLIHLMQRSGTLPRDMPVPAHIGDGADFFVLLFGWLLGGTERLMRRDLRKGYTAAEAQLGYIRGSIDPAELARGILHGRTSMTCRFEDYDANIAVNRLLRASLLAGLRSGVIGEPMAKRARRLLARFDGVDELRDGDLQTELDSSTSSYAETVSFAKQILRGVYRDLSSGSRSAWCFLWSTPAAVEKGIRTLVADAATRACWQPDEQAWRFELP